MSDNKDVFCFKKLKKNPQNRTITGLTDVKKVCLTKQVNGSLAADGFSHKRHKLKDLVNCPHDLR